ncbi:MAG TPA: hypothetical protein VK154_16295 [Chitinophagales bacterium]|nr:hypothetical protein [Chitinophagales bacterium]
MKTALPLLSLLLLFSFTGHATADTGTKPQPDQAFPLQLLPKLNVLYFNQTIEFTLPDATTTVDHVEFERGVSQISPTGFCLQVEYGNLEKANCALKVFTKDAAGNITLAYERTITLLQKLKDNVDYDDDLFMLDAKEMQLKGTLSKEQLLKATQLKLSSTRFNADQVQLIEFDMEIGSGSRAKKLHSPTGEITPEMKEAIRKLGDGDVISITNVVSQYEVDGQKVKMNINYTPKLTIGNVG